MRHLFIVGLLLLSAAANAQTIQRGEITLDTHGDVVKFGGAMQMLDAKPLASRAGLHRYIAARPTEGSFEHKYACGLVLTVVASRSSIITAARSLDVSSDKVPMYSVSQECFSFNGAEVDFHVSDFNMNGWDLQYSSGTGRDQTGQFKPDDPDRDIAAFNYIVPRFKNLAADYQRANPDAPDNAAPYKVGGEVSAPILTHSVDAQFSEEARRLKVNGVSVVSLVVDTHGLPERVGVVRSLGHGLDEQAIAAVEQYRFKPSMYRGRPVPVEVTINVNFRIY